MIIFVFRLRHLSVFYVSAHAFDIHASGNLNFAVGSKYARHRILDRTTVSLSRRCAFSSSRIAALRQGVTPSSLLALCNKVPHGLFSLLLPDDCRICHQPLTEFSRIPVCGLCIRAAEPMSAEFFCSVCRTPFRNEFPLGADGVCALCRDGVRGSISRTRTDSTRAR